MELLKAIKIIILILIIGYTLLSLWLHVRQERKQKEFKERVTNFKISNYENESKRESN
tara:strand:- start:49 stop:222 length:174 start_codon:yes stop_codon:yes gene_type:complete